MEHREISNIFAALVVFAVVASFKFMLEANWNQVTIAILSSVVILAVSIISKKLMAFWLDADVEHEVWKFSRYGWKAHEHLKKEAPAGIIFPLILSLFSVGYLKFLALLTFETKASKYRSAKRHGFYSFAEMTDWHNGLIGASGIVGILAVAILAYFSPSTVYLSKLAIYYAFCNMLPISKLDGNQIFFGSRILYAILAVITLIFFAYSIIL